MKLSFASTAFFRLFDRSIRPTQGLETPSAWTVEDVAWTHERHSYRGPSYQMSTDIFVGVKSGRRGWSVLVVRESWWARGKSDPLRAHQWAHLMSGARGDALAWFQAQDPSPFGGRSHQD